MELKQATRKQARIRLGLQGPSGSGKTFGALLIAYGLCNNWQSIAVIDTEHNSASLYSHLGPFSTIQMDPPFTPELYCNAIRICERSGIEVIIIDSASHEWDGVGGILDIHGAMVGNSFTNWSKVTPRHNLFIQTLLQTRCHVITTVRSKQEYVLSDKNGKLVPEKVGMKAVQRDGLDYELTTVFELDIKHNAVASKDRTSLFAGKPEFKLSIDVGNKLRQWCDAGEPTTNVDQLIFQIDRAKSLDELLKIFQEHPAHQAPMLEFFSRKRKQLECNTPSEEFTNTKNHTEHGEQEFSHTA